METKFTSEEIDLLVEIVNDWINEGIVIPPYEEKLQTLFDKLDIKTTEPETTPEVYPKTQEQLSRHGIKK